MVDRTDFMTSSLVTPPPPSPTPNPILTPPILWKVCKVNILNCKILPMSLVLVHSNFYSIARELYPLLYPEPHSPLNSTGTKVPKPDRVLKMLYRGTVLFSCVLSIIRSHSEPGGTRYS